MIRQLGLRGRLVAWISLALVLTFTALIIGVTRMTSGALESEAKDEIQRVVEKTAGELDSWLSSRVRDAVNLSTLEVFAAACAGEKLADAEDMLQAIHKRSPFYENVFLAHADGKEFADSIGGKSVGFDLTSVEGFRANVEHGRQGEAWIGEVMKSPASGRPVILITAPIVKAGQTIGLLGTPIELSEFSDAFIKTYKLGNTGYLFMFDSSGTMLAHPDTKLILNDNVRNSPGAPMMDQDQGWLMYTRAGITKIARFQKAQIKPWKIAGVVPRSELLAEAYHAETVMVFLGLVALAGSLGAAWVVAGKAANRIRGIAAQLAEGAKQTASAASQVSSSSQALAKGSSEQAASIEETSASAEEISTITRHNTDRSTKVADLMNQALPIVKALDSSFRDLGGTIAEVSKSSDKVSKVIKIIDEIAFQTNILALNAAVEAARAGEAGMGFAVVADEVRNLAQRSAGAAKETTALVEESLQRSRESASKLENVLKAMEANNNIAGAVKAETDQIGVASQEQARGIAQISSAIIQMNQVTQSTAAQAEESASAAEELNAQSEALKGLIERLMAIVSGGESVDESSLLYRA